MKYGFIAKQAGNYPVRLLCRVMDVKKSSYYDWKRQGAKIIGVEEFKLRQRIKAIFEESRESAGSRKLVKRLQSEGYRIGRYRVRRLMKQLGLVVKTKRKYRVTTDSKHNHPVADNELNRAFNPDQANRVWAADITYIWTQEGWLYLAVVMDLYSRRVVGWCLDRQMSQSLVIRALMMALALRKPPRGLMHHSDRGSQYASKAYRELLRQHGMVCSMSRKGNCWDNSPMERFFRSLKEEWIGDQLYNTREQAYRDLREYLMVYYNTKRLHSTLGYQTPFQFENNLKKVSGFY